MKSDFAVLGGTSAPETIVISNSSPGEAIVVQWDMQGTDGPDFRVIGDTCGGRLPEGESCEFTVVFAPRYDGSPTRHGTLAIGMELEPALFIPLEGVTFTQRLTETEPPPFPLTSVGSTTTVTFPLANDSERP